MSLNVRAYPLTIASGAVSSNIQRVENADRWFLYVPQSTTWNAGTGNVTITMLGAPATAVSMASIVGYSLTTDNTGGARIYDLGVGGPPLAQVTVATALSANGSAVFYLMTPLG